MKAFDVEGIGSWADTGLAMAGDMLGEREREAMFEHCESFADEFADLDEATAGGMLAGWMRGITHGITVLTEYDDHGALRLMVTGLWVLSFACRLGTSLEVVKYLYFLHHEASDQLMRNLGYTGGTVPSTPAAEAVQALLDRIATQHGKESN